MDNLTQPTITTGQTSRENKINQAIVHKSILSSPDIKVTKTAHGTTLTLHQKHKVGYTEFMGDYDPDAGYGIGQNVRVMPNTQYTSSNGTVVNASVGVWQCCVCVPSKAISDHLVANNLTDPRYAPWARITNPAVNYAPIWPEPSVDAQTTNDPADAQGRYWKLIGILPCA